MKLTVPHCMAVTVGDHRWFALRIRGGYADDIFAKLRKAGYDVYVPRRRYDRHQRRMRVIAEWSEPLMTNYMFVVHPRIGQPLDDWTEVRAVKGVVGPLGGDAGPMLIPPGVIEAMTTAEFEGLYDETAAAKKLRGETERDKLEKRFVAGKSFRVKDGPFASFLAEVEDLTHDDRVRALVSIFGRLTPVELQPGQLEEVQKKGRHRAA